MAGETRSLMAYGMLEFWDALQKWSAATFGPAEYRGPTGPLKHLEKEAREAYGELDKQRQRVEIADCLFLVFDAAQRAGMTFSDLARVAKDKLAQNKERTWPNWRTVPPDSAIEHTRDKDVEPCCECGELYPRAELMAGEVFCVKCRASKPLKERRAPQG